MPRPRSAEAVWEGSLKDGSGTMSMASGSYQGKYSFASRFEEGAGTNPEELIAAAHAGCFSMALSAELGKAGYTPKSIHTVAQVKLEQVDGKSTITSIHLSTVGEVPGIDEATFREKAEAAKSGCPVSRALGGVNITAEAKLKQA